MYGPEHLRIGDAERDAVTSALHEHFALGRLTRDELEERLTATLSAKTAGDLREITADLPPGPGEPHDPAAPAGTPAYPGALAGRPDGHWPGHGRRERGVERARGPWGPWSTGGPWGPTDWHRSAMRHRRPHAPLFPLIAVGLIATAVAGFWVLRFVLLVWLVMAILHFVRRWHHQSRGPRM